MGFIYKITNVLTNKCYIGETKKSNPYLRWNEHKNKIEKGIGCPALQDAVKKYGIENFKFQILIICFDEDRYKYEIEYIKKYNSMSPNGYNLTSGGEGGGFYEKKHSQESIQKIINSSKQRYIDNPKLIKEISDRNKILMNSLEIRNKIKDGINNSEKWHNAKLEKRIGNYKCRKHTEEVKNKISNTLKNKNKNVCGNNEYKIKQQLAMANSKGVKVQQFDKNGILINTFISLSEAGRQTGISSSTIQNGVKNPDKLHCGFIWKKISN